LPQFEKHPEQREKELKQKREKYILVSKILGAPRQVCWCLVILLDSLVLTNSVLCILTNTLCIARKALHSAFTWNFSDAYVSMIGKLD